MFLCLNQINNPIGIANALVYFVKKKIFSHTAKKQTLIVSLLAECGTMISWVKPDDDKTESLVPKVKTVPLLLRLFVKNDVDLESSTPIKSSFVTPSSY